MPFKVTVDGRSMTTEDLTVDELVEIEEETEQAWDFVIMAPLKTAKTGRAILKKILARWYDPETAAKRVGAMTFREIIDLFELVPDDRPTEYDAAGIPEPDPKGTTAEPATN